MNNNPPIAENQPSQISNSVKNTTEYIGNAVGSIGKNYTDIRTNVSNSLSEFSDKTASNVDASKEFLTSNTIIAKAAFVLLILILFLFFLYLGISAMQFIINPSNNPYLVKGLVSGNAGITIPQDPTQEKAVTLLRSNNKKTGLEFTWSTWIYIKDLNSSSTNHQNIFNKGIKKYEKLGMSVSNGPGMYISPQSTTVANTPNTAGLTIIMDLTGTDATTSYEYTKVDIADIPIQKWINVIIRMKNTMMDIYINGVISNRKILPLIPKQNYYDIQVCQNGGFSGSLSNLRYYDRALNVIQINNIVFWGPNLSSSNSISTTNGGFDYLASSWYTKI